MEGTENKSASPQADKTAPDKRWMIRKGYDGTKTYLYDTAKHRYERGVQGSAQNLGDTIASTPGLAARGFGKAVRAGLAVGTLGLTESKIAQEAAISGVTKASAYKNSAKRATANLKKRFSKTLKKAMVGKPTFMGTLPTSETEFKDIIELCQAFSQQCNKRPKSGETKSYLDNLLETGEQLVLTVQGKTKKDWETMKDPTKMDKADLEYLFRVELLSKRLDEDLNGTSIELKPTIHRDVYYVAEKYGLANPEYDTSSIPADIKAALAKEPQVGAAPIGANTVGTASKDGVTLGGAGVSSENIKMITTLRGIAADAAVASSTALEELQKYLTEKALEPGTADAAKINEFKKIVQSAVNAATLAVDKSKDQSLPNIPEFKEIVEMIGYLNESSQASLEGLNQLIEAYSKETIAEALARINKEITAAKELDEKAKTIKAEGNADDQSVQSGKNSQNTPGLGKPLPPNTPSPLIEAYGPFMYKTLKSELAIVEDKFNREYKSEFRKGPYNAVMSYKKNEDQPEKELSDLLTKSGPVLGTPVLRLNPTDPVAPCKNEVEAKGIILNLSTKALVRWKSKTGKSFVIKREQLKTKKFKYLSLIHI